MVTDLLPEEKRAEGFGMFRVATNLAWLTGPAVGGLIAHFGFGLIFVLDCVMSSITAVLFLRFVPETKPDPAAGGGHSEGGILQTLVGYRRLLRDVPFMLFLAPTIFAAIAYRQSYATLTVFLRDVRGLSEQWIGILYSFNALTVAVLQFWFIRAVQKYKPFPMMALGAGLFGLGLGLFGWVDGLGLFVVAVLLIAGGEMVMLPTAQAIVARFAPEDMRGRYMAGWG